MDTETKIELLEELVDEYANCDKCGLCNPTDRKRNNVVFADGNVDASLMIIGEAPGEQEDLHGVPFVGPAGDLFEKLLRSFNSSRDEVFITNVVCCRPTQEDNPRKNRAPSKEEIAACSDRLHQTIEIVDPFVILLLGNAPLKSLTKERKTLTSLSRDENHCAVDVYTNGQCTEVTRSGIVTFHPSYLLRNDDMSDSGDMAKSYYAWEKAFALADKYNEIYKGIPIPMRDTE
tara:strand:+ start:931 stop:1626 length:696 start_codon:yes stop_codon:yes gene_type:complete